MMRIDRDPSSFSSTSIMSFSSTESCTVSPVASRSSSTIWLPSLQQVDLAAIGHAQLE